MLQMKNELWDEEKIFRVNISEWVNLFFFFFEKKNLLSLGEKTVVFSPILCQTNETLQLILSFYF